MDPRTKWLLMQPVFWLGLVSVSCNGAIAVGLVPPIGVLHQWIALVLLILAAYGITGVMKAPPRISLDDMSKAEREAIFDRNPGLREKWEARETWTMDAPRRSTPPPPPSSPPPQLPPAA
jgi:hypothetical protein